MGRMEKIKARQNKIGQISDTVKIQSVTLAQEPKFIEDLIVQSCLMLLEEKVAVRCKKSDTALVKGVFAKAEASYARVIKESTGREDMKMTLTLDTENRIGGVVVCVQNGHITVDNTISARLELVLEQ